MSTFIVIFFIKFLAKKSRCVLLDGASYGPGNRYIRARC